MNALRGHTHELRYGRGLSLALLGNDNELAHVFLQALCTEHTTVKAAQHCHGGLVMICIMRVGHEAT